MDKIERIEKLIKEFFLTRIGDYRMFEEDEYNHRQVGIYKYKRGNELMDFLYGMVSNINESLYVENLIPQVHASPKRLIEFIKSFRDYIVEKQELIAINRTDEPDHTIGHFQDMSNELIAFLDHLIEIHDSEELSLPYKELRSALAAKDLKAFFETLNGVIGSVSYNIAKEKEGYLHTVIHVILTMLGFEITPEETTNKGRIDAVIRFTNIIYIFEFKNGTAAEALAQIEKKKYYQKYMIEKKAVIGIGVGFGDREVKDFETREYK